MTMKWRILWTWIFMLSFVMAFAVSATLNVSCTTPRWNYNINNTLNGFSIEPYGLVDYKNKLFLDWTPKADSVSATIMFFEHMGLKYGKDYQGWPHNLHQSYGEKCGFAHADIFRHNDWIRIKVVRNPYERVVSSYIVFVISKDHTYMNALQKENLSFVNYVKFLSKMND